MTWCPGLPMLIPNRLVVDGGWIERKGVTCFNLYRPPRIELGDATKAGPWTDHVHKVYRRARRCRPYHPLAGAPRAAPEREDQPRARAGRRAGHRQGHPARAGQARGRAVEFPRGLAGPPARRFQWLRQIGDPARQRGARPGRGQSLQLLRPHQDLHRRPARRAARRREESARALRVQLLGFIITTNHKTDGIYLPADDRRHYVAWSDPHQGGVFARNTGTSSGAGTTPAASSTSRPISTELDISAFDPKAPPPKTAAFWDIVNVNERAGGCRAGGRARCAGQPRRRDAEAADSRRRRAMPRNG